MTMQIRDNLRMWANKYRSQRCVILGAGPSLDDVDLSLLQGEFILALNAAYSLVWDFKLAWWVFYDMRALLELWPRITEEKRRVQAFVHKRGLEQMRSYRGPGHYVEFGSVAYNRKRTVLETALLIADTLGFEEVILVGVDFAVKPNQAYCKALSWKKPYFWTPSQDTRCPSCEEMLKVMREFMYDKRLNTIRQVFQTSPLFPDKELWQFVPFDQVFGNVAQKS